ncbi:MAG: DNA polymerase III subunit alpha [Tissierellia bacterium]|nr:DNA polymerase III subunit alpha [Tissierellia bacterium]
MRDFVHLHLHSEYSLLDGFCPLEELVISAKNKGFSHLAITDHGSMYGVVDFYKLCRKHGIQPIIGCEVYVMSENPRENHHLVLLVKDSKGYENLIRMVSQASLEHFYHRPRVSKRMLKDHSQGLIALSACLQGEVQKLLLQGSEEAALEVALNYKDIYGQDFYIEVQDHGLSEQKRIIPRQVELSKKAGIPLVVTNDVHYVEKEDYLAHDIILCIQTSKKYQDKERMRFPSQEFYLKDKEEMAKLFSYLPEALDNTLKIAKQCNFDFDFNQMHLAPFSSEEGFDAGKVLREMAYKGLLDHYGHDKHIDRLEEELEIIDSMGYNDFFLIVADFVAYARSRGIYVGPGRGSGGGSLVAYCIDIHRVDPMKYGLLFERFLNKDRVSMPDFDIDFEDERRQEVIDYVSRKYGADKVAQIITFGSLKARQAIKDVGKAFDMPLSEVDKLAKAIPEVPGMTLDRAIAESSSLRELLKIEENRLLMDMAKRVEGRPRHISVHAAGVVMAGQPLEGLVPLTKREGVVLTQYNMDLLEELGFLKMDFLGISNLTIIKHCIEIIEKNRGVSLEVDKLPIDDEATFELLGRADTLGIFQLESQGMRNFFREVKPHSVEDIIAGISLYRPGPMDQIPVYIRNKHNPDLIEYAHPSLKPILEVTYGVMVYQEQVMEMVRALAGYSYNQADIIRRAMASKRMDVMEGEKQRFIYGDGKAVEGAIKRGLSEEKALEIYGQMVEFANYAFNKSHASGYGLIAYQMAYLKTHYPIEFMAALMSSTLDKKVKLASYIETCRSMDIEVLPPHINYSDGGFTVEDGKIRYGLGAIKNVGSVLIKNILDARKDGAFTSFEELLQRLGASNLNKRAFESLIKAGALDNLGETRRSLLQRYELQIEGVQRGERYNAPGQISLFDELIPTTSGSIDVKELEEDKLLLYEKEVLGVYLSGHPILKYSSLRKSQMDLAKVAELNEAQGDGRMVELLLMKKAITRKMTRTGQNMAMVEMEDEMDSIEVVFFPKTFRTYERILDREDFFLVEGRLQVSDSMSTNIIAERLKGLGAPPAKEILYVRVKTFRGEAKDNLLQLLRANKGPYRVRVYEEDSRRTREIKDYLVNNSGAFIQELKRLFGEDSVVLK